MSSGPPATTVELPSGRIVSITMLSDPMRPWQIQYTDSRACTILRPTRGGSSQSERLRQTGQRSGGLVLEHTDAEALLAVLRSRVGGRYRRSADG
jgi:hypothetical protein